MANKSLYEHIFDQAGEKIIEWEKCQCGEDFPITDKDLEFYEKISPTFNGHKYLIPSPTLCPDCRQQRRLSFRNERKFYKRKCDLTGKNIISIYSPDKPYKVYGVQEWWSDKWNPIDYNMDYDFSRPFFEQFEELFKTVPRMGLILTGTNENTEYANDSAETKNCYLVVNGYICEDSYYSTMVGYGSRYLVDCYWVLESENCYECVYGQKLSNCKYCRDSNSLRDCSYCIDCIGCQDCFGCAGLLNKKYNIFNKQYTKENYFIELEKILKTKNYRNTIEKIHLNFPKKYTTKTNSENVIGNYFQDCKNCLFSFNMTYSEDSKYCYNSITKDCYDTHVSGTDMSLCLESLMTYSAYNCLSTISIDFSKYLLYCDNCYSCTHCFGCIGLRNKEYCILNKQYTKEEYEELVPKIIEHMKKNNEWGEFFPSSISPFGYNETVANEYYPLEKVGNEYFRSKSSERKYSFPTNQFNWSDYEAPFPKVDKTIPASKLPDDISSIPDDILNWAIECEVSGKPFRIIKQELEFYRKHNLPVPRRHPDIRHMDRMKLRNPRKLYDRKCDKCSIDIKTTYSPDRPEIVYCEECYNKEII